jgi:ethanolamine utilization protein EutN
MIYARVEGNITATRKHKSLTGWPMLICQPLDGRGNPAGAPTVAIDPQGAGLHEHVMITTDGEASRKVVGDPLSPVRNLIIGIIDPASPNRGKK